MTLLRKKRSSPTERARTPWEQGEGASGTVTRVAFQKRAGSERVNVHLDGAYAFSLAADLGMALREGQQLDVPSIRELLARDAADRAYQQALHFLAARPRSIAEVRRRLGEYGHEPAAIEGAVERLAHHQLVDDTEFAAYWVQQRQTFHPRGPRALRAELRQKGVERDAVDTVLEPVAEDQEAAAYRAGERKARSLILADEREFGRLMGAFLARRGFDFDAARTASRRLWADTHGTAEELDLEVSE
ncbi:MAG: regulatory protein [Chloroflexota bacterium]|jgi:regulatory protein|nr:regulatory protein [Chloroflexota bacterium]